MVALAGARHECAYSQETRTERLAQAVCSPFDNLLRPDFAQLALPPDFLLLTARLLPEIHRRIPSPLNALTVSACLFIPLVWVPSNRSRSSLGFHITVCHSHRNELTTRRPSICFARGKNIAASGFQNSNQGHRNEKANSTTPPRNSNYLPRKTGVPAIQERPHLLPLLSPYRRT